MSRLPAIVISGSDDVLRAARRTDIVRREVGDADAALCVTELAGDDYEMRELVDAAQTPPFFGDHRVVVGRDIQRFRAKDDLAPLLAYLEDPLPSTVLVLEHGGTGRVPKALADAVKKAGGDVQSASPGRKLGPFIADSLAEAGLRADRDAQRQIEDWLGDEPGKLPGLLAILQSTYGEGARLAFSDIEPFLGGAGGVPPWDLTDAIDAGDIGTALGVLGRMLAAGRHPMQLMSTLHTHFQRIMRVEGAGVRTEAEAAALLGMKGSTFPAKKALAQSRRLGASGVAASMRLLARTDLELRGTLDWPEALSMEVLVARLARVARTAR